jgi:hypothetical protein
MIHGTPGTSAVDHGLRGGFNGRRLAELRRGLSRVLQRNKKDREGLRNREGVDER